MGPPSTDQGARPDEESYYEVLGVPYEAPEEEIRKRYHGIVRTLHPDRRRPGSTNNEVLERFHKVQAAWRCLSDPTRRLLYDLRIFGRSSLSSEDGSLPGGISQDAEDTMLKTCPITEKHVDQLVRLQKEQSLRDIDNMQVILGKVLRREQKARGVIIRSALYGDLRLREDCLEEGLAGARTIESKDLVGPVIDVALPLQCLVEQHTIVLPGGASASKADLPGFFNPIPLDLGAELSLYVLYEFRGHLHEVIVGDRETLSLPFRKHAVPAGKAPRGPFSPANITQLRRGTSEGTAPLAAGANTDRSPRPPRSKSMGCAKHDGAKALQRAVAAYTLQRLQANEPGEATPQELAAVSLGAIGAVALTAGAAPEAPGSKWLQLGAGMGLAIASLWAANRGSKHG